MLVCLLALDIGKHVECLFKIGGPLALIRMCCMDFENICYSSDSSRSMQDSTLFLAMYPLRGGGSAMVLNNFHSVKQI
jgi:hypothetical protein